MHARSRRQARRVLSGGPRWHHLIILILLVPNLLLSCSSMPAVEKSPPVDAPSSPRPAEGSAEQPDPVDLTLELAALEAAHGGRLGVFAVDVASGGFVAYREDERFAYASAIKALLVAAVLRKIPDLERVVVFSEEELVFQSPVTQQHAGTGLTIRRLCEAALRDSDNTAANLLLEELGGPAGFEIALREMGDHTTMPARFETDLNSATPGDDRDTSTPRALARSLRSVIAEDLLPDGRATLLIEWMSGNATGDTLIRSGAPPDWLVADKSGTGGYGTRNDLAVVWPPGAGPIFIAVMTTSESKEAAPADSLVARAAALALAALG
ncbi:class A beta-lactamase [Microbacterium wangchenii]|uniref:Class A beta-lactamase n=1 Tax=Microbacterium wangchenii TaxID=2541726 RepID=A0ABX5SX19_9MICO|nr:class A beta-lactamase [Microbacterium wangchenii]QBR90746.1 class A beta-lactamase [Microbacterium wangchenii]TFV81065.1 class A beta-lactamase [Microbacterium sp. dk485]TXK16947.1 class A beta-lactamase [Microbacterium wangchenii]